MDLLSRPLPPARPPVAISVNGVVIAPRAIIAEIQYHPANSPGASRRKAAEALVLRELLLQEARRLSIQAVARMDSQGRRESEEEAALRSLVEREVSVPEPREAELLRYYQANLARFRSPDLFHAHHILIAAAASEPAAYAAAREKAASLAAELIARPDSFEQFARIYSACASAGEGGRLGQFEAHQTSAEFAAALERMSEGETTSRPVETRYGFHLIHLDRRIPGRQLPFEAVASRLSDYLGERAHRTASAQYLARLVSRARIAGIELAGADAHRVN